MSFTEELWKILREENSWRVIDQFRTSANPSTDSTKSRRSEGVAPHQLLGEFEYLRAGLEISCIRKYPCRVWATRRQPACNWTEFHEFVSACRLGGIASTALYLARDPRHRFTRSFLTSCGCYAFNYFERSFSRAKSRVSVCSSRARAVSKIFVILTAIETDRWSIVHLLTSLLSANNLSKCIFLRTKSKE